MILEMMLTTNPHLSRFFLSFTFCIKLLTRGKRVIIPVIRPLLISNRFRWLISWECVSEAWLNVNLKNRTHFKYSSAIITELWAAPLSFVGCHSRINTGDYSYSWIDPGYRRRTRSNFICRLFYLFFIPKNITSIRMKSFLKSRKTDRCLYISSKMSEHTSTIDLYVELPLASPRRCNSSRALAYYK